MQVSFQDSKNFRACSSLQQYERVVPEPKETERKTSNKAWRAIDYAPRHHQKSLSEPKMDFSRPVICSVEERKLKLDNPLKAVYTNKLKPGFRLQCSGQTPITRGFFRCFRPKHSGDDRVQRAREWRKFMMVEQYANPKPFNHRGVRKYL